MPDSLLDDPIINVVNGQILKGIRVTLENGCTVSAILLSYCAIDAMAYCNMPTGQDKQTRTDFKKWVEDYFRLPGEYQLAPDELYSARCGIVHQYGAESEATRSGKVRQVCYSSFEGEDIPAIAYNHALFPGIPFLDSRMFCESVIDAVYRYITEVYASQDVDRRMRFEERLGKMFGVFTETKNDANG